MNGNHERAELIQGTLEMLVLKALTWGANHGFGVARWIEGATRGELQIEEGALYPALHRMHRRGWLSADWGVTENGRRAKYYRLTAAGRRELAARVSTWERSVAAVKQVLTADGAGA